MAGGRNNISTHALGPGARTIQAETERALAGLRKDMGALSAADIAYTPAPGLYLDPQPTTVAEALDRQAAAGGTTPIP